VPKRQPGKKGEKAFDFRFDKSVGLVGLSEAARPNAAKNTAMSNDESIRHKYLNNLSPEQKEKKQDGYNNCQFNQFVSDQLSLHRRGRDTREYGCMSQKYYPSEKMPQVSVIIVFYNEARSTLLRTAWSVIDRAPDHLLKEVVLVDDGSTREHLKQALDDEVKLMPKTKVVRMPERGGLIRAKVFGVDHSSGEVLVFIDSHCEANDGWLEPLLDRIVRNRKAIAMPVIDVIDMDSFEVKQAIVEKGVFSWSLYFYWLAPRNHILETHQGRYGVDPLQCPIMAGGLFAVDRDYFFESGAYDMGQDTWGGENLEMSFRVWMCGGSLEIVPCSRIAHVFRSRSPYSFKDRDPSRTIAHNLNRVAEVWMDEYAPVYFNLTGNKHYGFGDVAERKKFRKDHHCHSFKWFMDNVAQYQFAPLPEFYHMSGQLKLEGTDQCVGTEGDTARLSACSSYRYLDIEPWYLTKHPFEGQIRHEHSSGSRCILASDTNYQSGPSVGMSVCFDHERSGEPLKWHYNEETHTITLGSNKGACLTGDGDDVRLKPCAPPYSNQKWQFVKLPYRS